jgi:hypothetical protein
LTNHRFSAFLDSIGSRPLTSRFSIIVAIAGCHIPLWLDLLSIQLLLLLLINLPWGWNWAIVLPGSRDCAYASGLGHLEATGKDSGRRDEETSGIDYCSKIIL